MSAVCRKERLFEVESVRSKMVKVVKTNGANPRVVAMVDRLGERLVDDYMAFDHGNYSAVDHATLERFCEHQAVKVLKSFLREMEEEQAGHRRQLPSFIAWIVENVVGVRSELRFREFKRIVEGL